MNPLNDYHHALRPQLLRLRCSSKSITRYGFNPTQLGWIALWCSNVDRKREVSFVFCGLPATADLFLKMPESRRMSMARMQSFVYSIEQIDGHYKIRLFPALHAKIEHMTKRVDSNVVIDASDKFSVVLAFVVSIVLGFLFANANSFIEKYRMYLECTKQEGSQSYNDAAMIVIQHATIIISFSIGYFLAWIIFKILNPKAFLKLCLIFCLIVYGVAAITSSLFFCREIISAMAINVNIDGMCNGRRCMCELSIRNRELTAIAMNTIMVPIYFTAIPFCMRLWEIAIDLWRFLMDIRNKSKLQPHDEPQYVASHSIIVPGPPRMPNITFSSEHPQEMSGIQEESLQHYSLPNRIS